jgi:hypothetical protein
MGLVTVLVVGVIAAGVVFVLLLLVLDDARRGVLLGLVVALLFGATSSNVPSRVVLTVQGAALALLAIAALLPRPSDHAVQDGRRRIPAAARWLAVLLGLAVVTTAPVDDHVFRVIAPIAVIVVAAALVASRCGARDRRVLLDAIVVVAVIQFALGLLEVTVLHEPAIWGYRVYADGSVFDNPNPLLDGALVRVQGTTGHPIPFGLLMAAGLASVAARWARFAPMARYLLLVVLSAGIVLSGSRSIVLAVLAVAAYLLLTSARANRSLRIVFVVLGSIVAATLLADDIAALVAKLLGSGSYENRAGALASVPGLLARPLPETLFGSGVGSELSLYARGLLPQNGFTVIDNQPVTTLATQGLLGLLILVLVFAAALRSGDRTTVAATVLFAVLLFSFDWILWTSIVTLFAVLVGLQPAPPANPSPSPQSPPASGREAMLDPAAARAGGVLVESEHAAAPDHGPEKRSSGCPTAPPATVLPSRSSARAATRATTAVSRRPSGGSHRRSPMPVGR